MKRLNLAIIGQGRSGRYIHGLYYTSERNQYYTVKYVVDSDAQTRAKAEQNYPGCQTLADYRELFGKQDVDVVVNATYSDLHYSITKELLEHGFHVLTEKPFARTRYECDTLMNLAREKGVVLAVFQQTFYAPFYLFAKEVAKSGKIGDLLQISIRYNGLSRRWDWQTLQKRCAGNAYNTGPHPIGMALGFLDFDPDIRVIYSKLAAALTSGDSDDYAKLLLDAPRKPLVDLEINETDAYSNYNIKFQGTKGTFKCTPASYEMTYLAEGDNPEQPVMEDAMRDANGDPTYCEEELVLRREAGEFTGGSVDVGTACLYQQMYEAITSGKTMDVTPDMAADIVSIIETMHAQNPLPLKYL